MRTARSLPTAVVSAVVAVVTAFAVAGCTGESDSETASGAEVGATQEAPEVEATPSASPEATPADPKQTVTEQRTADAIERFKEYLEITNDSYKQGESAYPQLTSANLLGSHEMREHEKNFGAELESRKYRQTGDVVTESISFVEYDGDPSDGSFVGHEIRLEECSDLTAVDYIDQSGTSQFEDGSRRLLMNVVMRGIEMTVNGESKAMWAVGDYVKTQKGC